jgi:hypothetical protein
MRRIAVVSLGLLLLVGCGGKGSKTGVVTGTITYKGQPVNGAALFLHPPGGGDPILIPVSQEGTFSSSDVPPGEYKVVVQGTAGAAPAPLKGMPPEKQAEAKKKLEAMQTPATIAYPDKYKNLATTKLTLSVVAGQDKPVKLELED